MTETARQSRYLDGTVPGMRNPRVFISDDRMYIQPDIDVAEMGEGATIEDDSKSICQRMNGDGDLGIVSWLKRNRNTILTGLAIYGGYRIMRR
ncbi:hypothetical protein IQ255_25925 [Pleurocapsales cyanobacterium LEGE 10410]|nr:hypothetical protein [Pleurocapsales cyanobacterium LEGE 10410]